METLNLIDFGSLNSQQEKSELKQYEVYDQDSNLIYKVNTKASSAFVVKVMNLRRVNFSLIIRNYD